jgi:DNA-binding PadR family transcriptional regulator
MAEIASGKGGDRMESLGAFEQLVLFCVLRLGDVAYGVTIRELLEERTRRAVSSGAIYTALARLEERGLVASWVGESTPGRAGRPPKYYRVEPKGARAMLAAYEDFQSVARGVVPKLTALAEGRS